MSESELSKALSGGGPPPSPPSRHPSISLQAAATLNAGLQRESPSRASPSSPLSPNREPSSTEHRRSQVLMNLQIADPAVPAPGEMVSENQNTSHPAPNPLPPAAISPRLMASGGGHHHRTPSLGELHQELENEQEFQVNRLLVEIRRLQEQVARQQQGQPGTAGDEVPDRAAPLPIATSSPQTSYSISGSLPRSPGFPRHPRSSIDVARRSRTPSRHASPRLRSTSITGDAGEPWSLTGRDESAFYQAETQSLMRENQMLRHRIRELERQLSELHGTHAAITHEPSQASHLNRSMSVSEDSALATSSGSQAAAKKAD